MRDPVKPQDQGRYTDEEQPRGRRRDERGDSRRDRIIDRFVVGRLLLAVGLMVVSGLVAASMATATTIAVAIGFPVYTAVPFVLGRWSWTGR
ncbi:hypothetical protein [Natrinema pallidum]|uniref:Uncharacterized protein n=1 Tax=Natrinema pallidum DSM 3751 TaxID=1227495 RepID=L9Z0U9_9EURY|nr:hypothetical protein [Natrinema pallidum]ELY78813.1 hypothetical protein C487_07617 [Natrinema pallidum DSM 3751]